MNWKTKIPTTVLLAVLTGQAAEKPQTFKGEVADSQCSMNVHSLTRSHEEMLKSKSMGGTARSCTLHCIQYLGGDLVLSSKNKVYRLDDQIKPREFAGQKVIITGTLDTRTDTIHVVKVEPQPTDTPTPKVKPATHPARNPR
jgi:hypothetical protein